jgi:hypothetical protein
LAKFILIGSCGKTIIWFATSSGVNRADEAVDLPGQGFGLGGQIAGRVADMDGDFAGYRGISTCR